MKPLIVFARVILVGCLWSIIFTEGFRVIMLENWRFDIFWPPHWTYVWALWSSGWVIDTAKEWIFILMLVFFVPVWLTGWVVLSIIPWEKWLERLIKYPFYLVRSFLNPIKVIPQSPVVVKKKSYKEVRPKGTRAPIYDYNGAAPAAKTEPVPAAVKVPSTPAPISASAPAALKDKAVTARETFSHSLFDIDDDDDDFDLDFDSISKMTTPPIAEKPAKPARTEAPREVFDFSIDDEPAPQPQRQRRDNNKDRAPREDRREREPRDNRSRNQAPQPRDNGRRTAPADAPLRSGNPVADVLTQKGYHLLNSQTIRNTIVDYIGIADGRICLCLIDKEPGDWLADEERFNNEEPLWFSESSHRISPVRKIDLCRNALVEKLEETNLPFEVVPYVVIQIGNIINAEDMFEIWKDMDIEVTRINRGSPKEIKLFSKAVDEAEGSVDQAALDTLRKIIRGLA